MDKRSIDLRLLVIEALKFSRKGHIGSAFSLIEILRSLYDNVLNYDVKDPKNKARDRLILSPGHGSLALYAILTDKGFIDLNDLREFCSFEGILGGCIESNVNGIEATTGSLGHGLAIGTGMAISSKIRNDQNHIFVIVGDGELGEGSNWESLLCINKHKLSNLTVIVDNNKVQCSGRTSELTNLSNLDKKFESFGFECLSIDGHNVDALNKAFKYSKNSLRNNVVICNTVMSYGVDFAEDSAEWHWKGKIDDVLLEKIQESILQRIC